MDDQGWIRLSESRERQRKLQKAFREVHDRDSFVAFVFVLIENAAEWQKSPTDYDWRNGTDVIRFFDGALAWAETWSKREDQTVFPKAPSWNAFAAFLLAGADYE